MGPTLADVHAEADAETTPENDEERGARIDTAHVLAERGRTAQASQPKPDGHDRGRGDFVESGLAQRNAEQLHGATYGISVVENRI
jgi:hypothetical protein